MVQQKEDHQKKLKKGLRKNEKIYQNKEYYKD
jgi:hypothetical protein